ncbi:hypothetical protein OROHE_003144 [Orobanche hederae]
MKMEGSVKSGVLKKKSSSGCLVIKQKILNRNSGGELGGLIDNSKEKNRARLIESQSGSSSGSSDDDESLELMRRKVNEKRLSNSSKLYKKNELGNRERGRDDVGIDISGERKRSRLELFDFDEYDEFDAKKMRNRYFEEFGVGSSSRNHVVDNGSSNGSKKGLRNKGLALEDDEANMPISLLRPKYQNSGGEPIRVQGKNGVLKVMVNKKKEKVDFPSLSKNDDSIDLQERKVSSSSNVVKKDLFVDKETGKKEEIEGGLHVYSSKKGMKLENEEEKYQRPDNFPPLKGKKGKEGKAQRGGSTEKQKLRENIRGMLLDSGWTIDYRPRRTRDYLDAVYINPSGTAYWSITKAYDAFKKQLEYDNVETKAEIGSLLRGPLSEDLIHKLTRQTKKKIKEEMRRKRKEDKCSESSDSNQNNDKKLRKYDLSDEFPKRKRDKVIRGGTNKVIGRRTLMVRGCDKGESSGKRTVLAWLIDSGIARLGEGVRYMNHKRTRIMLEGWITRDGIHCGCCSKILTVSKFEMHAGSKLRQPFQNIFLESGSSLLQCQIDLWNSQEESLCRGFVNVDVDGDDPDDDTCGICGDGGDLICCDSCPSTFHQICLDIQVLPPGDWHCLNCTCKFCGCGSGDVAEENNTAGKELNKCSFCEKNYHKSCSEKVNALPLSSNGASFCGLKCQELYDHFQKILGIKHELEAGFSWSLIQRKDVSDTSHCGFPQRVECNSKLAVVLSVMDECFLPIIDRRSGINLIHSVVYNCGCTSNFNRLNYHGFYIAILERGDEMISAASIRLHGDRLAEMPFIATHEIYRRQGMCRRLLSAIETELCSLKVRLLIIPTISEHMNTWTTVFGFHELEDVHKKEMKSMNMLVFPGMDILQKQLFKQEIYDVAAVKISDSAIHQPQLPVLVVEKSDRQASTSSDSGPCPESMSKTNDNIHSVDSHSPPPTIPSQAIQESDNAAAASISGVTNESVILPRSPETTGPKPESEDEPKKNSESNTCEIEAPFVDSISAVTLEISKSVDNASPVFEKSTEEVNGKPDEEKRDASYD